MGTSVVLLSAPLLLLLTAAAAEGLVVPAELPSTEEFFVIVEMGAMKEDR